MLIYYLMLIYMEFSVAILMTAFYQRDQSRFSTFE